MRLIRALLVTTLTLIALTWLSVTLARGNEYRCLLLYDGYTVAPEIYILDTTRGHLAQDRREAWSLYRAASPDGQTAAAFVERFGEHATMTLRMEWDDGTTRVVLTGVDGSSTADGYRQLAWANDGSAFAVMWRDTARRRYLTTVDAVGTLRRSVEYTRTVTSHPTLDPVIIAGWSGDGAYVVTAEYAAQEYYYYFFRAADLAPQPTALDGVPLIDAELAPHGDTIAAITINPVGTPELLIASISGARDLIRVPLLTNGLGWGVSWSPSGDHLVVERTVGCQANSCAAAGWHFDVFARDGTPRQMGLRGTGLNPNPSLILPGMWEGERWIWVERAESGRYDLSAVEARTGTREIMQRDLVADYADDMFYVPPDAERLSVFTNQPRYPMSRDPRLIVPFHAADGIAVDLINGATGERRALLRGVDRLMATHFGIGSDFWTDDSFSAWLSWESGGQAGITVADMLTGRQTTSDGALRAIWRPQQIDERHIGFIDPQPEGYALYLLDTISGEQTRLMPIERNATFWQAAISPNDHLIAAAGGNSALTAKPLMLLNRATGERRVLSETAVGEFLWSPDGEGLAFTEQVDRRAVIAVTDRYGENIRRFSPAEIAGTPLVEFVAWTRC